MGHSVAQGMVFASVILFCPDRGVARSVCCAPKGRLITNPWKQCEGDMYKMKAVHCSLLSLSQCCLSLHPHTPPHPPTPVPTPICPLSYNEAEYYRQALRPGSAPSGPKSKEPRLPKMPVL